MRPPLLHLWIAVAASGFWYRPPSEQRQTAEKRSPYQILGIGFVHVTVFFQASALTVNSAPMFETNSTEFRVKICQVLLPVHGVRDREVGIILLDGYLCYMTLYMWNRASLIFSLVIDGHGIYN